MHCKTVISAAFVLMLQGNAAVAQETDELTQLMIQIGKLADADMQRAMLEAGTDTAAQGRQCRPIDLAAFKAEFSYFNTKYEFAIQKCRDFYATTAYFNWNGLDLVKEAPDSMIERMQAENPEYAMAEAGSALRELTDQNIADYLSGASVLTTMTNTYLACARLAEQDADNIEYDRSAPVVGPDENRAIDRGWIICD